MKEARSVLFRSRSSPRIKAPQTLKTGLKQGLNSIKRQISLPNAKRIKKHCLHGWNQIQPDGRSFCSKVQTIARNKAAAYTKKLKQFPGTTKKTPSTAICGDGTHTVHQKIRAINKIGEPSKNRPSKLQNKISLTIGTRSGRRVFPKRSPSVRPSRRRGQGHTVGTAKLTNGR